MFQKNTDARAMDIVADPHAREEEWLRALAVLGDRLPCPRKKKVWSRLTRVAMRIATLTAVYSTVFSISLWLDHTFVHQYAVYTIGFVLPMSFAYAILETIGGAMTFVAAVAILQAPNKLLGFDPVFHVTWIMILFNLFAYSRLRWEPLLITAGRVVMRRVAHKRIEMNHSSLS